MEGETVSVNIIFLHHRLSEEIDEPQTSASDFFADADGGGGGEGVGEEICYTGIIFAAN